VAENKIQNWQKQGLIYSGRAQCPTVFRTQQDDKDVWRIFFADRQENKAFIRYIDVNPDNPKEILAEQTESVLPYGPPGSFDASGLMPSWVIEHPWREQVWMYYIGWTQRQDVPYQNAIGLAISYDKGKTFHKPKNIIGAPVGPVLSTDINEPYFTGTSYVDYIGGSFRLYYMSVTGWTDADPPEPMYDIKYRWSADGETNWSEPRATIKLKNNEGGIVRASVILSAEGPPHSSRMWYCYRNKADYRTNISNTYRIGYAESVSGLSWERKDELVNLPLSKGGFDSQMICYPYVLDYNNKLYMFYNGNGFGATGIGLATLEEV